LQTLLPKTRTLFCRLSSGERSRVCHPCLADCHLPKHLTRSITSKQTTCQLISRHVVSLKTRFPRCPNVSGKLFHPRESFPPSWAQRHVHLEQLANHHQARSPDQGRYGRAVLLGPSSTAALSTIWHVSALGIAIRVGPHIASSCVWSVLLMRVRAIGDFTGEIGDCMVQRYQLSSHALEDTDETQCDAQHAVATPEVSLAILPFLPIFTIFRWTFF
jgi:hypothetical protein